MQYERELKAKTSTREDPVGILVREGSAERRRQSEVERFMKQVDFKAGVKE